MLGLKLVFPVYQLGQDWLKLSSTVRKQSDSRDLKASKSLVHVKVLEFRVELLRFEQASLVLLF
jgi:hypothetical protein